ncbi:hypothetical protein PF010_g13953 [Phytophthora fragariae]|uniref:RxLR effector protein n=1 Tax=Phytophthora fragariae TaxID=53985 RepID=A0A6G0KZD3_9STRA|nr:hypothetical protein PF010_g13953 [Phytophthora fragariae]KAE9195308.1 hypothetical protein PF004_g20465 [Phytophthora fragariae]
MQCTSKHKQVARLLSSLSVQRRTVKTSDQANHPMRLSYALLLAAATTLLVSGETASGVSRVGFPDSVVSLGGNIDAEKRILCAYGNEGRGNHDEVEDGDNEEDDEEERKAGLNMFAESKLNEMVDSSTKLISRFRRWRDYGYTTSNLPGVLQAAKYDGLRK